MSPASRPVLQMQHRRSHGNLIVWERAPVYGEPTVAELAIHGRDRRDAGHRGTMVPQLHPKSRRPPYTERMRVLIDAHGREWRVFERTAGDQSPVAGRPSLIFDTDGMVRRLWRYPSSWSGLADAELLGLMDVVRRESPTA
jgi:hypothetical protein